MIYYVIVPKNITKVTLGHSNFQDIKKVKFSINVRNLTGKILNSESIIANYPIYYSYINNYFEKDTYIELEFFHDNKTLEHSGTLNVYYETQLKLFGISTGGLGKNTNSIHKKEISTTIVKNCCYLSENNNTEIYIINPNPTKSIDTHRDGALNYKILDSSAKVICDETVLIPAYQMIKINIKEKLLNNKFLINASSPVFTFISEQNFNVFPITFMKNKNSPTGCEHSQAKFSYFRLPTNGPQDRKANFLKLIFTLFK
ncbi:hypothetical protein MCEHALHM7_00913 [Methylophilaceae bacterium]